jgi:hypothetical protein
MQQSLMLRTVDFIFGHLSRTPFAFLGNRTALTRLLFLRLRKKETHRRPGNGKDSNRSEQLSHFPTSFRQRIFPLKSFYKGCPKATRLLEKVRVTTKPEKWREWVELR